MDCMDLEVIRQEKNVLEFVIKGERHTFAAMLKSILLENPEVTFAAYTLKHPMDAEGQFLIKTKSKDAKKVLLEAAAALDEYLGEFEKATKKAFK